MERVVALGRRFLPRGWRDFGLQIGIWFGFYFTYLAVRHLTDQNPAKAVVNGLRVISIEQHFTHHLFELTIERIADSSSTLLTAAAWTYWNSEFTVIGLTLLWVYLRRHDAFTRFRNTILLANIVGLLGFWLLPTAPPWMFPDKGFVDGVNHSSALLQTFGNSRTIWAKALWALWPVWVWFCVIATANHYVLDVLAGIGVAVASLLATGYGPWVFGRLRAVGPAIANLL